MFISEIKGFVDLHAFVCGAAPSTVVTTEGCVELTAAGIITGTVSATSAPTSVAPTFAPGIAGTVPGAVDRGIARMGFPPPGRGRHWMPWTPVGNIPGTQPAGMVTERAGRTGMFAGQPAVPGNATPAEAAPVVAATAAASVVVAPSGLTVGAAPSTPSMSGRRPAAVAAAICNNPAVVVDAVPPAASATPATKPAWLVPRFAPGMDAAVAPGGNATDKAAERFGMIANCAGSGAVMPSKVFLP
mmetsp:Transcript_56306/g.132701  ORF Transcript_56306/g.132701 Transcript_56306/m.132701 type:complete len:244 (-) Transcript_56306:61-792(-)